MLPLDYEELFKRLTGVKPDTFKAMLQECELHQIENPNYKFKKYFNILQISYIHTNQL